MGMKARRKAWRELDTNVVIGSSEATAFALGGNELDAIALVSPQEVSYLGFQHAYDAWTSANGTVYVCTWRKDPVFSLVDGAWTHVEVALPQPSEQRRVIRVAGISGPSPADDELYCLTDPRGRDPQCTLLWRRDGRWREVELPAGSGWALANGNDGEVLVSVGSGTPALLSVAGGVATAIPLPSAAAGLCAVGVCATADGSLLACFAASESEAQAWRLRDGSWTPVASDAPLIGWGSGAIDCVTWNGVTYLATNTGVFELTNAGVLELRYPFTARRLWPIGDAIVVVGFRDGPYAHGICRGSGDWQDLHVPEPDFVYGGLGKSVWLPAPRRKVRRKRVRMKKPKAATPTPAASVTDYCARWLEQRMFSAHGHTPPAPTTAADDLRSHFGGEVAPQLRRCLDLFAGGDEPVHFGELGTWPASNFALPSAEPTPSELARHVFFQQPTTIAALTGTVFIGADHGGQVYFVQVAGDSSEVFIYDPGQGALQFLADSLDSFMFLNDLSQQWRDYGRVHDVDFEDVENGDVDTTAPEIQRITTGLTSLKSRVNLDEDADVASEFHEQLPALTGVRPVVSSTTGVEQVFDSARWLVMALGGIYIELDDATQRVFQDEIDDPTLGTRPATKVYWLWHLFLFDDARLVEFSAACAEDEASLVRGTARLMDAAVATPDADTFAGMVSLREQVRAARAGQAT